MDTFGNKVGCGQLRLSEIDLFFYKVAVSHSILQRSLSALLDDTLPIFDDVFDTYCIANSFGFYLRMLPFNASLFSNSSHLVQAR